MKRKDLNDMANKSLEIVMQDLLQVLNFVNKTMFGSETEKKTQQLIVQLKAILNQAKTRTLTKLDVNDFVRSTQDLADRIALEKAKNPLISSELVVAITQMATSSVKVQRLFEKKKND